MLVVSYKKDYSTSCRGCVMDRYGSDFQIHHFITMDEVIEHCAKLNATTELEQDSGHDAWTHLVVKDGFENYMKEQQCFDPALDENWQSQGECESFFAPEESEQIKARSKQIYDELLENRKMAEKRRREQDEKDKLDRRIADAKKLLSQHKENL